MDTKEKMIPFGILNLEDDQPYQKGGRLSKQELVEIQPHIIRHSVLPSW